tara:strand:+ start:529 stop:768 length:240 start_codon:yes stop_codon:yes gene_type:complete
MLNEKKILAIVQDILDEKKINLNTSSKNSESWDSLNHLKILEKLDKISKGKAGLIAELATADSIKKIISILKKKKLLSR